MFTLSVWFLYRRRRKQPLNYPLIAAACALFILSTAVRYMVSFNTRF